MAEYVSFEEEKGPAMYRFGKYSTSIMEVKHLLIALVLITIAIMVLRRGELSVIGVVPFIIVYVSTIGLGFLLHELAHKLVAQYYGFISEFRADFQWMLVSIVIAFVGFLFLAPGAVLIHGRLTKRQNGIISVAGPLTNLALAIVFMLILIIFSPAKLTLLHTICSVGMWINAFLGVFNMLPIWVLDGKKVLAWNKPVYFATIISLVLVGYLAIAVF